MDDPDAPGVSLSLAEFCQRAKDLHDNGTITEYIKFTLNGEFDGQQYSVDPILSPLLDDEPTRSLRDFDSLLGIAKQVMTSDALTIWPVSKFEDTLLRPVYLNHSIERGDDTHNVPLHRIPNIGLGKWKTHNLVRVMFPALWDDHRRGTMTQEEQTVFYEKGLRPAIVQLMEQWSGDWPSTYSAEMIRARGANGKIILQSKILPGWLVGSLGDAIRHHLNNNGVTWAEGLFFLHQIKGVKGSSRHSDAPEHVEQALHEFLEDNGLPIHEMDREQWWINVGFEISSAWGNCLQWRTDHHRHAVSRILNIDDDRASVITRLGSSKYQRDMVAHMPAVSGCRITPGTQTRGASGARYLQLYTTDKSLTYRPTQHSSSMTMSCTDVFNDEAGSTFTNGLHKIYHGAAQQNPSHARMEVRVPLSKASSVLVGVDVAFFRECLLSFRRVEWWSFRLYRLMAAQYVFDWYGDGDPRSRSLDEALLLICALVWLINSLNSTPDLRSASRSLLSAALPHAERRGADRNVLAFVGHAAAVESGTDTDDPEDLGLVQRTVPYIPYGVIFLRPILLGRPYPVPRLEESPFRLSSKAFQTFFKVPRQVIRDRYLQPGVSSTVIGRVSNKARRTTHWINPSDEHPELLFSLDECYQLPPMAVDPAQNPTVTAQRADELDDINQALSLLWRTFIVDCLLKSPNPKSSSQPSYLKMSKAQREEATEDVFKTKCLSTFWTDCKWKIGEEGAWDRAFNHLWPQKGHVLQPKAQHYAQCAYYTDWCSLTARSDQGTVDVMLQFLRSRFNSLFWAPAAYSDRMWTTKKDHNFQKSSGIDESKAAPSIIINPAFNARPTW